MLKTCPLDIVYVKVSVNRKLLDSVRKTPFKTGNNFPTITLQRNEERKLDKEKISILVPYIGGIPSSILEYPNSFFEMEKDDFINENKSIGNR